MKLTNQQKDLVARFEFLAGHSMIQICNALSKKVIVYEIGKMNFEQMQPFFSLNSKYKIFSRIESCGGRGIALYV